MKTFYTQTLFFAMVVVITQPIFAQPAGYNFVKSIEIQASQVSGTGALTDFPVLISLTDPDLRSTSFGGNIENATGYDILFTMEDCIVSLEQQTEKYVASTGEYVVWVKIPTLSATVNTTIYMYYGNGDITSDPSTDGVWDSNYLRILHLHDDFLDASSYNSHATNVGSSDATGKIGDGQFFDGSTDHMTMANTTSNSFTISCWMNAASYGANDGSNAFEGSGIIWADQFANGNDMIPLALNQKIFMFGDGQYNGNYDNLSSLTKINKNIWYFVTVTRDGTTGAKEMFVNGVSEATSSGSGTNQLNTNPVITVGGNTLDSRYFNGEVDEVRFSNIIRSGDWIATEYSNQNSPSTFYTVSAQQAATAFCSALPINLLYFKANVNEKQQISLEWATSSELHNDYFTLERSADKIHWQDMDFISGAGDTEAFHYYHRVDEFPNEGTSYYRLKQTDFDQQYNYSKIKAVTLLQPDQLLSVFPNPAEGYLLIKGPVNALSGFYLYNAFGQEVTHLITIKERTDQHIKLDISVLPKGSYELKTPNKNWKILKQ